MMSIKKTDWTKNQKKEKRRASKKFTRKARLAAEKKPTAKSKAAKKNRVSRKKKPVRATAAVQRKSQSVETVSLEPKVWERAPVWELETFRAFPSLRTWIRR